MAFCTSVDTLFGGPFFGRFYHTCLKELNFMLGRALDGTVLPYELDFSERLFEALTTNLRALSRSSSGLETMENIASRRSAAQQTAQEALARLRQSRWSSSPDVHAELVSVGTAVDPIQLEPHLADAPALLLANLALSTAKSERLIPEFLREGHDGPLTVHDALRRSSGLPSAISVLSLDWPGSAEALLAAAERSLQ